MLTTRLALSGALKALLHICSVLEFHVTTERMPIGCLKHVIISVWYHGVV